MFECIVRRAFQYYKPLYNRYRFSHWKVLFMVDTRKQKTRALDQDYWLDHTIWQSKLFVVQILLEIAELQNY